MENRLERTLAHFFGREGGKPRERGAAETPFLPPSNHFETQTLRSLAVALTVWPPDQQRLGKSLEMQTHALESEPLGQA